MDGYISRVVDGELDDLLTGLPAIALEGPKAVGKTETALRRAATTFALDVPTQVELLAADLARIDRATPPVLIDEWQRYPPVWDAVRRSVDRDASPGRFLLTGSAAPATAPTHSGAGRIVRLRMRPLSLSERGLPDPPTVSLTALLAGHQAAVEGSTRMDLVGYTREILASGFPAIRPLDVRARRLQLNGYLDRVVDHDFAEQGHSVRRPTVLRAWLAAYAAATATTAHYNAILSAATPGEAERPTKPTAITYRDALARLWLLDPVPGWSPTRNVFTRLSQSPKHHLADPALAARLLGVDERSLLTGQAVGSWKPRDGALLGQLFESLVALSVRVYAQAADASVAHLRTRNGDHEIDLIVERDDRRVLAIEVKLGPTVADRDVTHLRWLSTQLGPDLLDAVVITTGPAAYRRSDGIAVVPAALLGP